MFKKNSSKVKSLYKKKGYFKKDDFPMEEICMIK